MVYYSCDKGGNVSRTTQKYNSERFHRMIRQTRKPSAFSSEIVLRGSEEVMWWFQTTSYNLWCHTEYAGYCVESCV